MPATGRSNVPLNSTAWSSFRADLRAFAGERLPAAMVPARFVVLPELPTLPNGKIDRGKLPAAVNEDAQPGYLPPQTPLQARIAQVWADVLGLPVVGCADDFFELGGNSLTAAQMAARVAEEVGITVNLRRLFEEPTVSGLARQLTADAGPEPSQAPVPASRPLGPTRPAGQAAEESSRSVSTDTLGADAILPEDVAPRTGTSRAAAPYRSVLLTGGTGYTGAFMLRELIDRSQAVVHVLVRSASLPEAMDRVRVGMRHFGVWRDGDERRLLPVIGNLARPYLGLSRPDYARLAAGVEMIIHNGALSSYALPYRALKPVNALGTLEVLRLACRETLKPVHYISSLGVYPGRPGTPRWTESAVLDPEGVTGGYRQTKWVGDAMMGQAHSRGMPVAVYRPGLITGAQATGACSTDTFINAAIKGSIQLGAYFELDAPLEITPVDYFAAVVAHIALSGGRHGTIFNVPGARTMGPAELFERVLGHGYRLRKLAYQDWRAELLAVVDRGDGNELARFLPLFGERAPADDIAYQGSVPSYDTANLRAALAGSGISCLPPDQELFDRYLSWFAASGYLPGPGERQ